MSKKHIHSKTIKPMCIEAGCFDKAPRPPEGKVLGIVGDDAAVAYVRRKLNLFPQLVVTVELLHDQFMAHPFTPDGPCFVCALLREAAK